MRGLRAAGSIRANSPKLKNHRLSRWMFIVKKGPSAMPWDQRVHALNRAQKGDRGWEGRGNKILKTVLEKEKAWQQKCGFWVKLVEKSMKI